MRFADDLAAVHGHLVGADHERTALFRGNGLRFENGESFDQCLWRFTLAWGLIHIRYHDFEREHEPREQLAPER
jgi:hypothetical protein